MAYQAETTFVPVIPSFRGFGAAMDKGVGSAVVKSGATAGKAFGKSFAAQATGGAGLDALRKQVEATAQAGAKAVKAAREAEGDAARKLAIEEKKLQELRDSGKAKASQLAAAEDRIIKSQRVLRGAQDKTRKSTQDLADAQQKGTRELEGAERAAGKTGRAFSALPSRIKDAAGRGFSGLSKSAKDEGDRSGHAYGRAFGGSVKGALGLAAGAVALVKGLDVGRDLLVDSVAEARESQQVGAKSTAIIKATGGAAKVSADQLGGLSTAISNKTGVDDEAIQSGSNLLLTFKQVRNEAGEGGKIFDRATAAAVDLSKAGFGSIEGSSKMLGKALNDPLKGISALSRAGVTFTDQQKEQIKALVKSGDVLGAQKIILGEVEGQVGGVAAASTTAGEKLETAWDNGKEALGIGLLPALDKGEDALRTKLLPLITDKLVPALPAIGRGLEKGIGFVETFGRIGGAALKPFVKSLSGGQGAAEGLVDFLDTHEGDITQFFVSSGHAAISFGKVGGVVVSFLLRRYVDLQKGIQTSLEFILSSTQNAVNLAGAAAGALGLDKQRDQLLGVSDALQKMRDNNQASDSGAGIAASIADSIDGKLLPALDKADAGLTKVGNKEVGDARQRDQAAALALQIKGIGTDADGSQVKLKHFSDITKLSAAQQAGLRLRLKDAAVGLRDQLAAAQQAGAGQDKLTQAWKDGKQHLEAEFRQMGLSKAEAKKLAAQYAGVPPKVKTDITQPGMKGARSDTKDLDNKINGLNGKKVKITYSTNAGELAKQYKIRASAIANTENKPGQQGFGFARGGMMPGYTPGRDVHRFVSPTGGVLDLSGGEPVMRPEFGRVVGKGWVDRANAAARTGGTSGVRQFLTQDRQQALATGGVVRNISTAVNAKLGLPDFGSVTDRIALGLGQKLGASIGSKLAKAFEANGGGNTGKALSYAKAHAGHPYQFGTLWDCSGFISALHSIAKGEQPHRRYVTTSFVGEHANGFTRGKKSGFMVGVNPKPGKSGHMAGTIRGTNVESRGGDGVVVGKRARGYNSPLFSWRGGLKTGGIVGDLPFDLINPRGRHYDPALERAVLATPSLRAQLFDNGGLLQPGLTLAMNGTGRPERIRTEVQERALQRDTRPANVTNHHNYGVDARQLAREIDEINRVKEIMNNLGGYGY